jgi:hypothetical protein
VLLALVYAHYRFIEVNAGSLGKTVMMKDSQIGKWEKRLEERN